MTDHELDYIDHEAIRLYKEAKQRNMQAIRELIRRKEAAKRGDNEDGTE